MHPAQRFNFRVEDLFTRNTAMARCLQLAQRAAQSDAPALILGETGTGKTLLAQAIHHSSKRARGRFISFNASAMSDTLLESQLFGHERGAFTGAHRSMKGKFELADSGTLFLDEVADMSLLAQAKILRAVEYGEFEPLGSERMRCSNARILSATNTPLRERIRQGSFREDLYHRLAGLTLHVPALRDRPEDLPGLIALELAALAGAENKRIESIHPEAMRQLLAYPWPGNLRELHHTIRSIVLFCEGPEVLPDQVLLQPELFSARLEPGNQPGPATVQAPAPRRAEDLNGEDLSLAAAIRRHIERVYAASGRNQRETARRLGVSRSRLARHLRPAGP